MATTLKSSAAVAAATQPFRGQWAAPLHFAALQSTTAHKTPTPVVPTPDTSPAPGEGAAFPSIAPVAAVAQLPRGQWSAPLRLGAQQRAPVPIVAVPVFASAAAPLVATVPFVPATQDEKKTSPTAAKRTTKPSSLEKKFKSALLAIWRPTPVPTRNGHPDFYIAERNKKKLAMAEVLDILFEQKAVVFGGFPRDVAACGDTVADSATDIDALVIGPDSGRHRSDAKDVPCMKQKILAAFQASGYVVACHDEEPSPGFRQDRDFRATKYKLTKPGRGTLIVDLDEIAMESDSWYASAAHKQQQQRIKSHGLYDKDGTLSVENFPLDFTINGLYIIDKSGKVYARNKLVVRNVLRDISKRELRFVADNKPHPLREWHGTAAHECRLRKRLAKMMRNWDRPSWQWPDGEPLPPLVRRVDWSYSHCARCKDESMAILYVTGCCKRSLCWSCVDAAADEASSHSVCCPIRNCKRNNVSRDREGNAWFFRDPTDEAEDSWFRGQELLEAAEDAELARLQAERMAEKLDHEALQAWKLEETARALAGDESDQ